MKNVFMSIVAVIFMLFSACDSNGSVSNSSIGSYSNGIRFGELVKFSKKFPAGIGEGELLLGYNSSVFSVMSVSGDKDGVDVSEMKVNP